MAKILKDFQIEDSPCIEIELKDGTTLFAKMEGNEDETIEIYFFEDEDFKNRLDGKFEFVNQNYEEYFNSLRLRLFYMFSPDKFLRQGIGEIIIRWVIDLTDCTISVSNPYDPEIRDGGEVTGDGLPFVDRMIQLGLIEDYNFPD